MGRGGSPHGGADVGCCKSFRHLTRSRSASESHARASTCAVCRMTLTAWTAGCRVKEKLTTTDRQLLCRAATVHRSFRASQRELVVAIRHFLRLSSLHLKNVRSEWRCHYLSYVRHSPRLITELLSLADAWGWSVEDLADALRIDRTTLLQYRSGRRPLTVRALAQIAARFGAQRMVRDLVWHHLTVECNEEAEAVTARTAPVNVPAPIARLLRSYVDRFAEVSLLGRGLYLVSADASALSGALQYLHRALEEARIPVCRLRADRSPAASESRSALAAPVLLIERFDFTCAAVADLVRQRGDLVRPTIVTSMHPISWLSDPYLRRILTSMTRIVEIGSLSLSLPTTNGPVPAESDQQ